MTVDEERYIEVGDLVVRYGSVTAVNGISFSVRRGELLTLLGPSGCGKTTALRAIAGLERPESGEIRIGGKIAYSSVPRINVPTEARHVSMVFQSYAIWPHMSVFDNVAYALRVRRMRAEEIEHKVRMALELVRLGDLAKRSAAKLSGGQQQRVALARAIVFSPVVLLLDEPLSNLDARLRAEMRMEIKELQRRLGMTAVYVTHDQEEALAISDRVVVMNAGAIEQTGSGDEIYNRPRNSFVADFIGSANLIHGTVRHDLRRDGLVALETSAGAVVYGRAIGTQPVADGAFAVRTTYPRLLREPEVAPLNQWRVRIRRRVFLGDFVEYLVDWESQHLVVRRLPVESFEEGEELYLVIEPHYCVFLES